MNHFRGEAGLHFHHGVAKVYPPFVWLVGRDLSASGDQPVTNLPVC
jgi:hypothetical protein